MFSNILEKYKMSLDALRDFIKHRKIYQKEQIKSLNDNLPMHIPRLIFRYQSQIENTVDDEEIDLLKKRIKLLTILSERYYQCKYDKNGKILKFSFIDDHLSDKYYEPMTNFGIVSIGSSYVLRSILINMVSEFEILLKNLLLEADNLKLIDNEIDEQKISFSDLKDINDINEARKVLVERYLEESFYNSILKKIKFVQNIIKTDLSIDDFESEFVEIYERRNLYVHNDGIINNRYLNSVNNNLLSKYKSKFGNKLPLNEEYIQRAIDIYEVVGIKLISNVWKKVKPNDHFRWYILSERILQDSLLKKRYYVSEHISYLISDDKNAIELIKDLCLLDRWFAIKAQGKYKMIEQEVLKADFSSKSDSLRLGLLAIQEKQDEFFSLLKIKIESNSLSIEEYNKFPIFEKMRKTAKSKRFLLEIGKKTTKK